MHGSARLVEKTSTRAEAPGSLAASTSAATPDCKNLNYVIGPPASSESRRTSRRGTGGAATAEIDTGVRASGCAGRSGPGGGRTEAVCRGPSRRKDRRERACSDAARPVALPTRKRDGAGAIAYSNSAGAELKHGSPVADAAGPGATSSRGGPRMDSDLPGADPIHGGVRR